MDLRTVSLGQIVAIVTGLITQLIGFGLVLLIAAAVWNAFGYSQPFVRALDPTPLAWLCGAWYLYRK